MISNTVKIFGQLIKPYQMSGRMGRHDPVGQNQGRRHRTGEGASGASQLDVRLSKSLSYLLRHGAPKEKVSIHPGGFIDVDEILSLRQFANCSLDKIRALVDSNDKQRFTLRTDEVSGKVQICANQGHSFEVEEPILESIKDPALYPVVIHGTYLRHWESIKKSGLSRMNRIHIHFAPGVPGDDGVISGMRKSAELHIYIDIAKALNDGIQFYRSANNVILSPGNSDGFIEAKYFLKVVNIRNNQTLSIS